MAKQTDFFKCFSINLHNFLKASGIRAMNDGEHTDGITVKTPSGEWQSFPNLFEASVKTDLSIGYLKEKHKEVLEIPKGSTQRTLIDEEGYEFAKRTRKFWVYLVDDSLEKALRNWKETGPQNNK